MEEGGRREKKLRVEGGADEVISFITKMQSS